MLYDEIMKFFMRAWYGLLALSGDILRSIERRLEVRQTKEVAALDEKYSGDIPDDEFDKAHNRPTLGVPVDENEDLLDVYLLLPEEYSHYKIMKAITFLSGDIHSQEMKDLKRFYFTYKRFHILLTYKFKNKIMSEELEKYRQLNNKLD